MIDKDLYFEIVGFLEECGGEYRPIKPFQCRRIIGCLDLGQYMLRRNNKGEIIQFCAYWKVSESDFPMVAKFEQPGVIDSGEAVFSVDYASRDGVRGAMQMFLSDLPVLEPDVKTGCFEHKGRFMVYDRTGDKHRPWKLRR